MERIWNNEPSTPDSSDQTINISFDTKKEPKPESKIDPEEVDYLIRKFESEVNDCLHSVMQDCIDCVNPPKSDVLWVEFRS